MTPTTTLERNDTTSDKPVISGILKLQEMVTILSVTRGSLGKHKQIDARELGVIGDVVKAQKVLMECAETALLGQLDSEITSYLALVALPGPFKRGTYVVNNIAVETAHKALQAFKVRRTQLVDSLANNLGVRIEEQRKRFEDAKLSSLFNYDDYPSAEALRSVFRFTWQWLSLQVPNALPPALQEEERAKMDAQWQECIDNVDLLLTQNLKDLLDHAIDKLNPTPGQLKPKVFRDSTINNIKEFLQLFDLRNVTGNEKMEAIVQQTRDLLGDIEPDAIRNRSDIKKRVREGFAQITEVLDTMIIDSPKSRRINLDED